MLSQRLSVACVLVLFLLAGCASVRPAEESVDLLLEYTMQEDQLDEFLGVGMGMSGNNIPTALQEDMMAFIKKHLDMDAMKANMRTFYLERFSAEELQVVADFQITPAAQKFQRLAPELVAMNATHMQSIMVDHRDEFMEMIQKHAPAGMRPPGQQQ